MKPELTFNCPMCEGREYHCYSYIDALATGQIHKIGEVCPFYDLWTSLYLAKEIKRLHLVPSVEPMHEFHRAEIGLLEDCFINNGDDGGW